MKSTLKHYAPVAGLLAGLTAVALLLVALATPQPGQNGEKRVVATTYPLYLAAKNIAADTDTAVVTLSGAPAGCLHDYQLSPADRLALEKADCLLINGAGTEPFLEGVPLSVTPTDTSAALPLLCGGAHHDHDHEQESYNEHVWTRPQYYRAQVAVAAKAMAAAHPELSTVYERNAADYMAAIRDVEHRLAEMADNLTGTPCVVFHPSLAYFAEAAGLNVRTTLSAGEESGLSAGELAEVEHLLAENPDTLLLYDSQYPLRYPAVDAIAAPGRVLTLYSGTTGPGRDTDWLDAMERNLTTLQTLSEVTP